MGTTTKIKWTDQMVLAIIEEARKAGSIAAEEKLQELQNVGPQYGVRDGSQTVGTMLDVCGFAHLKIKAKSSFYLRAKKLSQNTHLRFLCNKGYYGGGELSIFDSTMRQEMSVNVAACQGQARILEAYGIECSISSRID